jgi:hypothetical protein
MAWINAELCCDYKQSRGAEVERSLRFRFCLKVHGHHGLGHFIGLKKSKLVATTPTVGAGLSRLSQ